jgi:hypothetical protein
MSYLLLFYWFLVLMLLSELYDLLMRGSCSLTMTRSIERVDDFMSVRIWSMQKLERESSFGTTRDGPRRMDLKRLILLMTELEASQLVL